MIIKTELGSIRQMVQNSVYHAFFFFTFDIFNAAHLLNCVTYLLLIITIN